MSFPRTIKSQDSNTVIPITVWSWLIPVCSFSLSAPHPRSTSQSLPSSPSTSRPGSWWALSLSFSPKENAGKGMIHSILASPYYQAHLHNYTEESTVCFTTMMTETVKDAKPQGDGRRRCGEKDPLGLPPTTQQSSKLSDSSLSPSRSSFLPVRGGNTTDWGPWKHVSQPWMHSTSKLSPGPLARRKSLSINKKWLYLGGRQCSLYTGNKNKRGIKRAKHVYY